MRYSENWKQFSSGCTYVSLHVNGSDWKVGERSYVRRLAIVWKSVSDIVWKSASDRMEVGEQSYGSRQAIV